MGFFHLSREESILGADTVRRRRVSLRLFKFFTGTPSPFEEDDEVLFACMDEEVDKNLIFESK